MRKLPTGEPCAGKPPARFGGRGGASLPYPYRHRDVNLNRAKDPEQASITPMPTCQNTEFHSEGSD